MPSTTLTRSSRPAHPPLRPVPEELEELASAVSRLLEVWGDGADPYIHWTPHTAAERHDHLDAALTACNDQLRLAHAPPEKRPAHHLTARDVGRVASHLGGPISGGLQVWPKHTWGIRRGSARGSGAVSQRERSRRDEVRLVYGEAGASLYEAVRRYLAPTCRDEVLAVAELRELLDDLRTDEA